MKIKMILTLSAFSICSLSWDGYDYDKGTHIEIGKGNLVRSGNDIEVYDYDSGEYRTFDMD